MAAIDAPSEKGGVIGRYGVPVKDRRASVANVKPRVMYVELKSGFSDDGPAWIGRVSFSKTGRTVYYRGRQLERIRGGGVRGNFVDVETGEEFWVSGVKKDGADRHRTGRGEVEIDEDAREEYERIIDS